MKIKSKIKTLTLIPVTLAIIVGIILFFSYSKFISIMDNDLRSDSIVSKLFELNVLTADYLKHPSESDREQWQINHDSISKLLELVTSEEDEGGRLLNKLRQDNKEIRVHFDELLEVYNRKVDLKAASIPSTYEERLVEQILIRSSALVSLATKLDDFNHKRLAGYFYNDALFIGVSSIIIVIIAYLLSSAIGRSISGPISKLHKATEIISAGNLDYKTDIYSADEIGQLSQAFNDMTNKFKLSRVVIEDNEERLNLALAAANQGLYDLNIETGKSIVNPDYAIMLGYDPHDFEETNQKWIERLHPDDRERVLSYYRYYINGEIDSYIVEFRQKTRSGDWKWILSRGNIVEWDEDNNPVRMLGTHTDINDRKQAEEALGESEERFRSLVESTSDLIWEIDENAVYTYVSPKVREILGYEPDEILGKTPFDLMPPEGGRRVAEAFTSIAAERKPFSGHENTNIHKDGHLVTLDTSGTPVFDTEGTFRGYRGIDRDITNRIKANEAVKRSFESFKTIMDSLDALVYVADIQTYEVLFVNKYGKDIFGDVEGKICWQSLQSEQTGPCDFCTNDKLLDAEGKPEGVYHWEFRNTVNGCWYDIRDRAVEWIDGRIVRMEIATDITDRKAVEEKLKAAAITDDLTGLFNRRGFFALAAQQCKLSERTERTLSLLYLDIDGFKSINDELGHDEGDLALKRTARLLKNTFRESDIIARMGGDEFVVLLSEPSLNTGDLIMNHLTDQLRAFNANSSRSYELMLSIGMAFYDPENPCSIGDLLTVADKLMYKDKKRHKLNQKVSTLMTERRVLRRLKAGDDVWAVLDNSVKARVKDISLGGVCIESSTFCILRKYMRF